MKNRHSFILVLVTCLFVAFSLGFLAGRATAPGDTIVAQLPRETSAVDSVPTVTQAAQQLLAADIPADITEPAATVPVSIPATVPQTQDVPVTEAASSLININTATLEQLDSLPGIGPVIAQRIIDYRTLHGPFTAVSQLTLVDGIGEKRLAAIIDLITVK